MANQFVALPAPAANGAGAWVDVSSYGPIKTVTVAGNGGVFEPFVTIEYSNQNAPTNGVPLRTFSTPDEDTFNVACHWMRAVVSNYKGGGAPVVELGGTDSGASFAQLTVPVGNGQGAGVDVSSLGLYKTVQVAGAFRGALLVEVSEDGGATYSQAFPFANPGGKSQVIAADFMRVTRNGVPTIAPGQPEVWVGASDPGGGGGGSLDVQLDGVDVVNPATILNFQTPGMFVEDEGGGSAKITGTLLPVSASVPQPNSDEGFDVTAGEMTHVDSQNVGVGNRALAILPLAASVLNGTLLAVKLENGEFHEGDFLGRVDFTSAGVDTIDGQAVPFTDLDFQYNGQSVLFVSNGNDNWDVVAVFGVTVPEQFPKEQAFIYTASGSEDPAGFPVNLPVSMDPSKNYIVNITMGENTDELTFAAIVRTSTTITVEASAAPFSGDELLIFVKEVTN